MGVYLSWDGDFYHWLAGHYLIFPALSLVLVGLVGAVPLIVLLRKIGRPVLAVWAIVATFLAVLAARAYCGLRSAKPVGSGAAV